MLAGQGECEGKAENEDMKETSTKELVGLSTPQTPAKPHGGKVAWSIFLNEARKEQEDFFCCCWRGGGGGCLIALEVGAL